MSLLYDPFDIYTSLFQTFLRHTAASELARDTRNRSLLLVSFACFFRYMYVTFDVDLYATLQLEIRSLGLDSLVLLFRYIYVSFEINVHATPQFLNVCLFCRFLPLYIRFFWHTSTRQTSAPCISFVGLFSGSLLWVSFVGPFCGSLFWVSSAIYTSLCTVINMPHHGFKICAGWSTCVSIVGLFVSLFRYTYVSFDTHLNATPCLLNLREAIDGGLFCWSHMQVCSAIFISLSTYLYTPYCTSTYVSFARLFCKSLPFIFFCCFLTYIFTPNHTFSTCASARWPQTHAATQTFSYNFFFDFHMSLSTYFNIPRRSSPICARRDARRPKYNRATQNLFCRSLWDIFTTLLTYIYILHRSFSTCARRSTTEKQWRNLKPFVKRDSIWYNFFLL